MQRISRRTLALLLLLLSFASLEAQRIEALFLSMPSELLPQLPSEQRQPLIDANSLPAETASDLGASVKLLRLEPYLQLQSSSISELCMQVLPREGMPALILLINTVSSPHADSRLSIYSQAWEAQALAPYFQMPSVAQFFASREVAEDLRKAFETRPFIHIEPLEQEIGLRLELDRSILSQEMQTLYKEQLEQAFVLKMLWKNARYTLVNPQ